MLIVQKMISLFILMGIGFFCSRKKWMTQESSDFLSKIVINFANPAVMIAAGLNSDTGLSLKTLEITVVAVIVFYAALLITAPVVTKLLHVSKEDEGSYKIMYIFGNIGFMGIPIARAAYGEDAVLLLTFFNLGYTILMYTYGIATFEHGRKGASSKAKGSWKNSVKQMINAGTAGSLLAIICFVTKVKLPDVIPDTLDMVGNLAAPLSMFVIGASLEKIPPKELISDRKLNWFILIRLVVVPVVGIFIAGLFIPDQLVYEVFYIVICVPIGSLTAMMANQHGGNTALTSRGVALSTLLSVITIPAIGMLMI